MLTQYLHADGALAGDHLGIIERMKRKIDSPEGSVRFATQACPSRVRE